MKKLILASIFAFATTSAFAYCEVLSRKHVRYAGGHQEATYCGSGGCITLNGGYELPYTIRYDFWKGTFCK